MKEKIVLFNDQKGKNLFILKIKNWNDRCPSIINKIQKNWNSHKITYTQNELYSYIKKTLTRAGYVFERAECFTVTL